jgi:hypothetical protein
MLEITIATAISVCVLGFLSIFCSRANLSWSGIALSKTFSDVRILLGAGVGAC